MSKWLLKRNTDNKKYLIFCLPHAGSGSIKYLKWEQYLDDRIEICPIMLPGREQRIKEDCIDNFDELLNAMFNGIKDYIPAKNYSIFGHSMGSILAYELAKRIEKEKINMPDYVFLSGTSLKDKVIQKNWKEVDDSEIIDYLYDSGGTPVDLIDNDIFKDVFLPILRNDHCVVSSYHFKPEKISALTKIHIFAAKDDNVINVKYSENVRSLAYDSKISYFIGGHFFYDKETPKICEIINEDLINDHLI